MLISTGCALQVQDLHMLLEMYRSWQRQFYPYVPYDDFLSGCEKLSSSHILKVRLAFTKSLQSMQNTQKRLPALGTKCWVTAPAI